MTAHLKLYFIFIYLFLTDEVVGFKISHKKMSFSLPKLHSVEEVEDGIEKARNNPIAYEFTPSIKLGHKRTDLLLSIWSKVAFPSEDVDEIIFKLSDYGLNRNDVKSLLTHFQTCKDCAGDHAFLMAAQDEGLFKTLTF
jgi:hypothetical protein